MKKLLQKPIIMLLVLALGIGATLLMVKNRAPVSHKDTAMAAKTVDVIKVQTRLFRARVKGYGNVKPAIVFQGKAELSGKIIYLHPDLRQGGSIAAGTTVVRIDPDDFLVSLKQSEADFQSRLSSLKQLQEEKKTTSRSLALASANLKVGEKELARIRGIWNKRLIARSTVDAEEQKVILLRQSVSNLQGSLNTYASRISSEQAQIARAKEQVKGQETMLARTEIQLPFDARIGDVPVEKDEFVSAGSSLFEALNLDAVEINVQVPVGQMQALVQPLAEHQINLSAVNLPQALNAMKLQARVALVGDLPEAIWDGQVLRFSEAIDPVRRTLGIVVAVDKPYQQVIPGRRPPLIKGMFTEVEIFTPAYPALIIPYQALHQGRVYLVNKEGRLEIRKVSVQTLQGNLAVIESGLNEGEQVIVNDLIPVIKGMPLKASINQALEAELDAQARGMGAL
ncbi:MAG: efflux RND transporter periplasmic adaptor subunit [Pontibacterium sp.]